MDDAFLIDFWEAVDTENCSSTEYRDFVGLLLKTSGLVNMQELDQHPWLKMQEAESIL